MSAHLEQELIESIATGGFAGPDAKAHLAGCAECARELAWAKAERALLMRRPTSPTQHLWSGVAARIARERRLYRPRWAVRAAFAAAAAAAAAAVVIFAGTTRVQVAPQPKPAGTARGGDGFAGDGRSPQGGASNDAPPPGPDAKTLAALDRAEADYRDAAKVLEDEYGRLRPQMDPKLASRWDETLTRARTQLGDARKGMVAQDVNARMRVLDGYAGYLRSLRTAVLEQEAIP